MHKNRKREKRKQQRRRAREGRRGPQLRGGQANGTRPGAQERRGSAAGKPAREARVPASTARRGGEAQAAGAKAETGTPKPFAGRPGARRGPSGRRARPRPFPAQAAAFAPAPWTPSLSLLLLSVPLLLTGGRWEGRGGEAPHSEAPPRLPPGSEPAPYLVVLHVSVGPVFQQQEGRLHVIDSGCPVKGGFSCTGNSRVSRRENGVACSRCEQASSLAQGSLALPGARQEAGSPWGPVGRT